MIDKFIIKTLDKLYPNPDVPLHFQDVYTLLVAVVLSAQCTDKRVNEVTKILFSKANTPEKMVKLGIFNIKKIIHPCGLSPQKSKAIYNLSKIIIEKFQGKVPSTFEDLESLPGVGHKTASVVMSQGFNVPAFPVDTHIHRLSARWGLSDGSNVKKTEEDLKKIFPKKKWNKLHIQMILYGREYCPARSHDLKKCIICSHIQDK